LNPFFASSDQVLEPGKGYRFNDGLFRDWQPGTHGSGSMIFFDLKLYFTELLLTQF
jgi:hypothetical protein